MTKTFVVDRKISVGKTEYGGNSYRPDKMESGLAIETMLNGKVEAHSPQNPNQVRVFPTHGLFAAAQLAFEDHFPLTISPDAVWLTITQGLAAHINRNAEKFRDLFVSHQGKKKIEIRRDEFVRGSPDNDWTSVFDDFSRSLLREIGEDNHRMVVSQFSTTGPVEKVTFEVALMDAVQKYFDYHVGTLCGIPQITLMGTVEDWKQIASKIDLFDKFDLRWWTPHLRQVLSGFVEAASGKVDEEWWLSCYKYQSQSGGDSLSGWLTWLLPYVNVTSWDRDPKTNEYVTNRSTERNKNLGKFEDRLRTGSLPIAISKAPFTWNYLGKLLPYQFAAGLTGVEQDPETLAVQPTFGWAVQDLSDQKANRRSVKS